MVVLVANVTMSEFRPMPKMPLYGIDWLGIVLWSLFILTAIYIFFYGEQYDWLNGPKIRVAIGCCMILLAICLLRMNHIRHPFIDREAFKCPNLLNMLILFFSLDILLGTQNVLQNTFTGGIMGYDQLVSSQLKWPEFLGGLAAALFALFARIKLKWHLKILTFISMSAVVVYNILMVGLMSPAIHISQLWLPLFFLGFGHVGVFIALTVYAQANSNFKYYFQVLCILGFIRTGLGDAVSVAIWERALQGTIGTHLATIGSMADLSAPNSFSMIGEEATLSALRGLYGWAVVFGVAVLILILCSHFDRLRNPLPTLKQAYIIVSRAIRRDPKESTYTL
jgi:hypothetical protein